MYPFIKLLFIIVCLPFWGGGGLIQVQNKWREFSIFFCKFLLPLPWKWHSLAFCQDACCVNGCGKLHFKHNYLIQLICLLDILRAKNVSSWLPHQLDCSSYKAFCSKKMNRRLFSMMMPSQVFCADIFCDVTIVVKISWDTERSLILTSLSWVTYFAHKFNVFKTTQYFLRQFSQVITVIEAADCGFQIFHTCR